MMTPADEQAAGERAIFGEFARASGLPVRSGSIESRPVPEPDIRCVLDGEGAVAFELGEVVSEALERATSQRVAVRQKFRAAYEALPPTDRKRVEDCLDAAPAVFAGFRDDVPPGRWRNAVQPLLEVLVERAYAQEATERLRPGDIPVWQIPRLNALLTDVAVQRSSSGRPFLGVLDMTPVTDATWRLLEKKFGKRYPTDVPVELLAYYVGAPPPREVEWRRKVGEFLQARWQGSPFRRVWLFDGFTETVILAHPG